MNKLKAFLTDLIFPNRCPVCREIIEWDKLICGKCDDSMEAFPKDICPKCGKDNCICGEICYDRAFVCFYYEDPAKKGILSLKDGHKEFGAYLGRLLGEKIAESNIKADGVIPVPMSESSYRIRRYNQAEIIAKQISNINNIPLFTGLIGKNESAVQHTLGKAERMKNTAALYGSGTNLDDMSFILCDDVITTGSTINRCAEILKEMGAAAVYAAVGTTTKLKKE
ncbi:MAG: double zinc ribbon domain-containing protein [Clostridium sp.]|nr:double zinc ribbon domain-containing protein [Clostridium sp.]MCM1547017.1 double zinc ribbon domain-containing protein [Ruminococcus sp.]